MQEHRFEVYEYQALKHLCYRKELGSDAVALLADQRTCDSQVAGSSSGKIPLRSGLGQATSTCASVTKQYNLMPANGVISLAGKSNRGPGGK